jgi:flavin prenyltransferase
MNEIEPRTTQEPPLTDEELRDFRTWRAEFNKPRRIIIGMSGASGAQWGIRTLEVLSRVPNMETHLVVSSGSDEVMKYEMGYDSEDLDRVRNLATVVYDNKNMAAAVSSGSFKTEGMVVVPCSVKTLSEIASANDESLISRAAFCTLKEGRRLVIVPRETPLTLEYGRNLVKVMENGAQVLLPVPAFYHRPKTVEEIIDQTVGKILDQFDIDAKLFTRWETPEQSEH